MVNVTVAIYAGDTLSLELPADNCTVADLKSLLVSQLRCSPESMFLVYQGQRLEDNISLQNLGMLEGTKVHLFLHMPEEYEVFVWPPTGELQRIPLDVLDTAEVLYTKLQECIPIGPSMQLLHNGSPLPPNIPISSLRLGPTPQINLWPKPPI